MSSAEASRSALSRSVAADLDAIFTPSGAEPAGAYPSRVRSLALAGRPARSRAAALGTIAAAALAGLAAGSLTGKLPAFTTPHAPVEAAAPTRAAPPYPWPPDHAATTAARPAPTAQAVQDFRPTARATPPQTRRVRACAGHRCSYAAVMDADRQLRRAYWRATRAGVPRGQLVSYRREWTSLRRLARRDPDRIVIGYRALARDLDRAAGRRS